MLDKTLVGCLAAALLLGPPSARAQEPGDRPPDPRPPASGAAAASDQTPDLSQVARLIVEGTNRFRRDHGLPELKENDDLTAAARYLAGFMARTDKYGHTADGKQPWDRTADHGYESCLVAENIAWEMNPAGFTTRGLADALVRGWENSPPHRKNMLDPDLKEIGVGVAHSEKTGRYYAVEDFGRPKADEIRFRVTNNTDATVKYTVDGKAVSLEPGYTMSHRTCRPPELTFEGSKTHHPQNGARFVLRDDGQGGYTVSETTAPSAGAGK
jgi:uncharacterized protein YkwD